VELVDFLKLYLRLVVHCTCSTSWYTVLSNKIVKQINYLGIIIEITSASYAISSPLANTVISIIIADSRCSRGLRSTRDCPATRTDWCPE